MNSWKILYRDNNLVCAYLLTFIYLVFVFCAQIFKDLEVIAKQRRKCSVHPEVDRSTREAFWERTNQVDTTRIIKKIKPLLLYRNVSIYDNQCLLIGANLSF